MINDTLPRYRFDPAKKKPLKEFLPKGYYRKAMEIMSYQGFSQHYVLLVAKGQRYNDEIHEALAWVALEELMKKLFNQQ